jgi:thiol-disulfide isomerase/thioredoxin
MVGGIVHLSKRICLRFIKFAKVVKMPLWLCTMKKIAVYIFTIVPLVISCREKQTKLDGIWRAEVPTAIGPVPFNLKFESSEDSIRVYAVNGTEELALDGAWFEEDSLHITMEVFDAEIVAKVEGNTMHGVYRKKLGNLSTRSGEFKAVANTPYRFIEKTQSAAHDVAGKWAVTFTNSEGKSRPAIGVFEQGGNEVTGTFLTATGDYRYLAGNVVGDSLMLSSFDGTSILLFKAKVTNGELINGKLTSSLLNEQHWQAVRDENAALPDPNSLTYLKEGYENLSFSFPNTDGEMISLKDSRYKNKVMLVQILGSWCPNCMDESKFYVEWLTKHPDVPVEIIGLAFEKKGDADFAYPKIRKMKERFGMEYEILLAGSTDDTEKALPMLNNVMSFPTSIFVDKRGKVRKIHTGFSGPGTGKYYEEYKEEFDRFMQLLISEKINN